MKKKDIIGVKIVNIQSVRFKGKRCKTIHVSSYLRPL